MTIEIISSSISTKVWVRAGIKLATPESAARLASVARHVNYGAMWPSYFEYGPVVQEMTFFKIFLIESSGGHLARRSKAVWACWQTEL